MKCSSNWRMADEFLIKVMHGGWVGGFIKSPYGNEVKLVEG